MDCRVKPGNDNGERWDDDGKRSRFPSPYGRGEESRRLYTGLMVRRREAPSRTIEAAASFALARFGGLKPVEAREASDDGSAGSSG